MKVRLENSGTPPHPVGTDSTPSLIFSPVGPTKFSYPAAGQMDTEDGPLNQWHPACRLR